MDGEDSSPPTMDEAIDQLIAEVLDPQIAQLPLTTLESDAFKTGIVEAVANTYRESQVGDANAAIIPLDHIRQNVSDRYNAYVLQKTLNLECGTKEFKGPRGFFRLLRA